jgi:hypothetical protein
MDIDKLQQLADMHRKGELTDAEFALAKSAVLQGSPTPPPPGNPPSFFEPNMVESIREGVNTWIKFRVIMAVVAGIIFLIFALLMFGRISSVNSMMPQGPVSVGPAQWHSGPLTPAPGH